MKLLPKTQQIMACNIKHFKQLLTEGFFLVRQGGADAIAIWHTLETFLVEKERPLDAGCAARMALYLCKLLETLAANL